MSILKKLQIIHEDLLSDDVMFWVECDRYQSEVTGAKVEYIEDNNGRSVKHITFIFEELNND